MSKPKVGGWSADRASPHPSKGELRVPARSSWNEIRDQWCVEFWCLTCSMYQLLSTGRGWRGDTRSKSSLASGSLYSLYIEWWFGPGVVSFLLFILVHSIQKDTGQSSTFLAAGACDEIQTHPIKSERVEGGERMINLGDLLDPCFKSWRFS